MGAIELASPVWAVGARDRFLGWSRKRGDVRVAGLKRTMDLATCIAVPPYSHLRAGKLLAAIACSSTVGEEFRVRYDEALLAVFATCATGLHYPQVNRVRVRGREIYTRVGQTGGYSAAPFSPNTVRSARELVHSGRPADRLDGNYLQLLWVMRMALRACNIPEEPVLTMGVAKGVYIAPLVPDGLDALRSGRCSAQSAIGTDEAIGWWTAHVLARALKRDDLVRAALGASSDVLA